MQNYTLKEFVLYFLKLGTIGFGGPVALVGYTHKNLVENYKWISEAGRVDFWTKANVQSYFDGLTIKPIN
ncbi:MULTISPECIES: chromate transporter [Flavobacterium]|uniref:chromate transporter n=1 Tax=Flavobacterium TaxID=237 RepID=UPI001F292901|nr:chromate transporter [Flavobacterium gawalongense]